MFYGIKFDDEPSIRKEIVKYINFYNKELFQDKQKGMTSIQFGNHANFKQLVF